MDELNDKELTEIIERLSDFKTMHKGIRWTELEQHLPRQNRPSWVYAIAFLGLFIPAAWLYHYSLIKDEAMNVKPVEFELKNRFKQPIQSENGENLDSIIENTLLRKESNHASPSILIQKITNMGDATHRLSDFTSHIVPVIASFKVDSLLVSNIEKRLPLPIRKKNQVHPIEKIRNNFRFHLEGGYTFGVAVPNAFDEFFVTDYKFKPSFSFKLRFDYLISERTTSTYYAGIFYQRLSKNFNFASYKFSSERLTNSSVREQLIQHQLGTEVRFVPKARDWEFSFGLSHAFTDNNSLLAKNWLNINLTQKIFRIKEIGIVTIGATTSIPLISSSTKYLRYYPIQLSIGLEIVR